MDKEKKGLLQNPAFQTILSAVICILIGILVGFIVMLIINPSHAAEGMIEILQNFMHYKSTRMRLQYFGSTLVQTAPLLMCALSVCFCYKVGLFNIGAAGQYTIGAAVSMYAALAWHLNWFICILLAIAAGALVGALIGFLKATRNVNEVISGIMLNWIGLYCTNMLMGKVTDPIKKSETLDLRSYAASSVIPSLGLDKLTGCQYMTIAVPLSIIIAIVIWVILKKTKFGYELIATGYNKDAAKYAGMKENRNIVITLAIGGGLASCGAAFLYLTGSTPWSIGQTSVPGMGFNGIAATFLGGLHPIGSIFASYFIQHITDGGAVILDKTQFPAQMSDLITGLIIYSCGFTAFFKMLLNNRKNKKSEKAEKGGNN